MKIEGKVSTVSNADEELFGKLYKSEVRVTIDCGRDGFATLHLSHAAAKTYPIDRRVVLRVEPR